MSPNDRMVSMAMSTVALCALEDNPLYSTFIVLQRDLIHADFDELEKWMMDYYHGDILHMQDTHKMGPKILMASDISGTLDSESADGMSHHPRSFCTEGFVNRRFRVYHVLADAIPSGFIHQRLYPLVLEVTCAYEAVRGILWLRRVLS